MPFHWLRTFSHLLFTGPLSNIELQGRLEHGRLNEVRDAMNSELLLLSIKLKTLNKSQLLGMVIFPDGLSISHTNRFFWACPSNHSDLSVGQNPSSGKKPGIATVYQFLYL